MEGISDYSASDRLASSPDSRRAESRVRYEAKSFLKEAQMTIRIPAEWEPHACCWMAWAMPNAAPEGFTGRVSPHS